MATWTIPVESEYLTLLCGVGFGFLFTLFFTDPVRISTLLTDDVSAFPISADDMLTGAGFA